MTKYNNETRQVLIKALGLGAPIQIACKAAGITDGLFRRWRKKAIAGDKKYLTFFIRLKKAEGEAALAWLTKIEEAIAKGTWQAAAWKLERLHWIYFSNKAADLDFEKRLSNLEKIKKNKSNDGVLDNGKVNDESAEQNPKI